ncbi:hypothetical protein CAEBREN_22992 [Caenorhabditis brenneri]|uniref:Uncharacterized protein n=1 Tax=Caenorhabditis brenneri TaxID=135651 RepID=G0NAT0_CAEBE|nr:hypothetical protein CAEBREN_22992 [Caenorhabditis brenneri]
MSIIFRNSEFAILDEQKFYNQIFEDSSLKIQPELFEIHSKFMPDSQFEAIQKRGISNRKRKRETDKLSEEVTWIKNLVPKIQENGKSFGVFSERKVNFDNNLKARRAAEIASKISIPSTSMSSNQIVEFSKYEKLDNLLCNGMISNWIRCTGNEASIIENSENEKFFIPPGSTFHIGDVKEIEMYSELNEVMFDLVVADPPWFCQSVKRKKTYDMNEDVIDSLNISDLTSDDALIAFWITNRKGIEEEMKSRFEKWNMEVIATWNWLKMTTQGQPVYDFDNEKHKVPFEKVLIAKKKTSGKEFNLPQEFVFARPLELFARSLLPFTHSIGFEPILLQSEHVFIPVEQ